MKRWIAWFAMAVIAVCCVIGAVRVFGLVPQVQTEMNMTPSPSPVFGNTMIVTPDPGAPTSPPVLKNGSSGDKVREAQQRLQALGYYTSAVDGQYGNGTRAAVTLFQQVNSLDADGVIGPDTSAVLFSDNALPMPTASPSPVPTPVPTPSPEPTGQVVEEEVSMDPPYLRSDGLPLVVNRTIHLPQDYQPWDLVKMSSYCDSNVVKIKYDDTYAERAAVDALMVMLRAAISQGISNWQISAAYRDEAYQKKLFDNQVKTYMKENGLSRSSAISATRRTVADPGTSEHHLGTSFDITVPGKIFKGTKQADWLAENCWDYGFILRYQEHKTSITGFAAEAWHFRWVGKEHSLIMRDEDLCLEEYLEKYGRY